MSNDSVEILRARVNAMKRLMAERNMNNNSNNNANANNNNNKNDDGKTGNSNNNSNNNASITEELWSRSSASTRHSGIINGQFLSIVLCTTLGVIVTVAFYAFYNLYHAVLKKFPSRHTEL